MVEDVHINYHSGEHVTGTRVVMVEDLHTDGAVATQGGLGRVVREVRNKVK